MTILGRLLERRGADPTQPWGNSNPPVPSTLNSPLAAGVVINDTTAMQLIAVYACVSILADAVSTLPLAAYMTDATGIRRRSDADVPLLYEPWPDITLQDWLSQIMVSLLLRGNAYGLIIASEKGVPTAVQVVHPDQVAVDFNKQAQLVYKVAGKPVDARSLIHIKGLTIPGQPVGMSPITAARSGIALAKATEMYGSQFFANSAEASGVISVDGDLTEDNAKALATNWMAAHQGINKAHLPAVLTGGAKWTAITINPDDAQFLQTRDFQRHEIAMLYRVPEHMIGIQDKTTSWGAGIEQMEIGFVINTLRPWLTRIEAALSKAIEPMNLNVRFDLSGRLRGDTGQRFTAYAMAVNNGWMCIDEIRALEDLPPLPDGLGQRFFQSVQAVPAGQDPAAGKGAVAPDTTPDAET